MVTLDPCVGQHGIDIGRCAVVEQCFGGIVLGVVAGGEHEVPQAEHLVVRQGELASQQQTGPPQTIQLRLNEAFLQMMGQCWIQQLQIVFCGTTTAGRRVSDESEHLQQLLTLYFSAKLYDIGLVFDTSDRKRVIECRQLHHNAVEDEERVSLHVFRGET